MEALRIPMARSKAPHSTGQVSKPESYLLPIRKDLKQERDSGAVNVISHRAPPISRYDRSERLCSRASHDGAYPKGCEFDH
jgi:hypothetical protein